jgi:hypothetical protein
LPIDILEPGLRPVDEGMAAVVTTLIVEVIELSNGPLIARDDKPMITMKE